MQALIANAGELHGIWSTALSQRTSPDQSQVLHFLEKRGHALWPDQDGSGEFCLGHRAPGSELRQHTELHRIEGMAFESFGHDLAGTSGSPDDIPHQDAVDVIWAELNTVGHPIIVGRVL